MEDSLTKMLHTQECWQDLERSYQACGVDFICNHCSIFALWWDNHAGLIRKAARRFLSVNAYQGYSVPNNRGSSTPLFESSIGGRFSERDLDIRLDFLKFVAEQGITESGWQTKPTAGKMRDAWL